MKIEYDSEGKAITQYISGPRIDEIIAKKDADGKKYYYLRDGLNSVRMVMDERGNVVQRLDYDAFGEPNQTTDDRQQTTETTFGFTGREFDSETGLYFYRARYYAPDAGRFLQEDPIGLLGGMNLYAYVGNNPINWIDPLGWEAICPWSFFKWLYTGSGHSSNEVYQDALDAAAQTFDTFSITIGGSLTIGHLTQNVSINVMNASVDYSVNLSTFTIFGASVDISSGQPGGVYDFSVSGVSGPAEHSGVSASFDSNGSFSGISLHYGGGLGLPVDFSWDFVNDLSDK